MKKIKLTRGKYALVDDADYEELSKYKWHAVCPDPKRDTWYAHRRSRVGESKTMVSMHRSLLRPPANRVVDHIDGNGLNNQRSNIRIATHSQNTIHSIKAEPKTASGYWGVYAFPSKKNQIEWLVQVYHKGKSRCIGMYKDKEEAARVFNEETKRMHGEFARQNLLRNQP